MIARPDLPYPGLRAFERDENVLFFGREGCVDQMLATLAETRFLAVLGSSGSGKSSLVRTGLLNALERGMLVDAGAGWLVADFHPGSHPMRSLAAALTPGASDDVLDALESMLGVWPQSLVEWAQFGNLPPGKSLLLLVDQFEELFRYGDYADREATEAFVTLLLQSAQNAHVPIYVVLTMRSEYLGSCALIPDLAERINRGLYLTPRMDRESCREAIEGPARVFGFSIDQKLVNQILNDIASFAPFEHGGSRGPAQLSRRADQLPLMQHLLNRLWTRAKVTGGEPIRLGFDDYEAIGGLEGALDSHGAAVIEALSADVRPAVETVFRALVFGADPASAVRRPVPFAELEREAGSAAAVIVNAFRTRDCNFLRPESHVPLSPDTLVDISHESLIRQWSRLAGWTRAEASAGDNWRRLAARAERWQSGQGELLTGLDLTLLTTWWNEERPIAAWAERHGGQFDSVAHYLTQSQTAEKAARALELRRTQRERRRMIIFSSVAGTLALVAAGALFLFALQGETLASQRAQMKANRETQEQMQKDLATEKDRAKAAAMESERLEKLATLQREDVAQIQRQHRGLYRVLDYCKSEQLRDHACAILRGDSGTGSH